MVRITPINFNQNNRQNTPSFQGGYFNLTGQGAGKHAGEIRTILSNAGAKFDNLTCPQTQISGNFGDDVHQAVLAVLEKLGKNEQFAPIYSFIRFC